MKQRLDILSMFLAALAITMLPLVAFPVHASAPTEPHLANSMWIEPSVINVTDGVGHKFNVTIYLNISTADVFQYQIALLYNRTQLKATRAAFTMPPTSEFMQGHATTALINVDESFLGNGSVLVTEALSGTDVISPPHVGSLVWIEFKVLIVPPSGQLLTSEIDIESRTPADTWVWSPLGEDLLTADDAYNALYVIPEFPPIFVPAAFIILTFIAIILATKLSRLKVKHTKLDT